MKLGLMFANTMAFATAQGARILGPAAEAAGFESVWTVEHVLYPEGYESVYPYAPSGKMPGSGDSPIPDPMTWLSFIGATTSTIKLATGILILPQRQPAVLAKSVATVDSLTEGRVILGIGVGWLKEEFAALDVPWERRGARTDEYIDVLRSLWATDGVTHNGTFVNLDNVSSNPKPANGTVPIHIGGHSRAAAERAGRIGDGFFPGTGNLAELIDIARQTAADAGRDPAAIEVTAGSATLTKDPSASIDELQQLGVDRMAVPSFLFAQASGSLDSLTEAMSGFTASLK